MQKQPQRKKKRSPENEDEEQSRLFIDTAREIGADEEHSAAEQLLGKLAEKKPDPRKKTD
jgi:hypothetical protein